MKNISNVAPITAAVALCGILALLAFAPVSASNASFSASTEYLPEQIVNQAKDIVPQVYEYSDVGLAKTFPKQEAASYEDAAPMMYN
ncbi:MAG TPA: hypothetical protein VMI74_08790 [Burkholderiales bacterium]|nr:hypothetical protein [Burkholderiales bacterium]